jgi:hypothetical protein
MTAELVNLTAARIERRPPERDTQCRDCGRVLADLVHLADHYAHGCRPGRTTHPSAGQV